MSSQTGINYRLLLSLIIFLTAISYLNILYSPFVLDDYHSFIEDPGVYINDFSLSSLKRLSEAQFGINRFIPMLTFAIDHWLFALHSSITQYHLTNILIHLLTTISIYFFIKSIGSVAHNKDGKHYLLLNYFAIIVAGLWAVNPVHTNAVTYTVQRMASLAALFYITSLVLYIHARKAPGGKKKIILFLLSTVSAVCAFFSKENTATLPIAILLVERFFINRQIFKDLTKKHILHIIIAIIAISPLILAILQPTLAKYSVRSFSLDERILTESRVVLHYISILILPLPSRLNLDHDFPVSSSILIPQTTFLSILLLATILIIALKLIKQRPLISFGILWFFIHLVIESTIIPLEIIFEHRLYLPSVGLFISVSKFLVDFSQSFNQNLELKLKRQATILLFLMIVCISSLLTSTRNHDWRDAYSIYHDAVSKSPDKSRTHVNMGVALADYQNRPHESIPYFEKAIALSKKHDETFMDAYTNLIASLVQIGEYEQAINQGEEFITKYPANINMRAFANLMQNLGTAYEKSGDLKNAIRCYISGYTFIFISKPVKNNLFAKIFLLLKKAYEDDELKENFSFELHLPKETSIQLRIARLMFEIKDYERATSLAKGILTQYPENEIALEYLDRIKQEEELNKKARVASSIESHIPYQRNIKYRLCYKAINFIFDKYPLLTPVIPNLIDIAKGESSSKDPFLRMVELKWQFKSDPSSYTLQLLERSAIEHSNFVPILEEAGKLYRDLGQKEKAASYFKQILSIYPGHPDWFIMNRVISNIENMPTN